MSISPPHSLKVGGLQRLICLKSYNVQKWKIRFTLWLNAAKNTPDIKKSCLELNFIQKSPRAHTSISSPPPSGARGSKDQYV